MDVGVPKSLFFVLLSKTENVESVNNRLFFDGKPCFLIDRVSFESNILNDLGIMF